MSERQEHQPASRKSQACVYSRMSSEMRPRSLAVTDVAVRVNNGEPGRNRTFNPQIKRQHKVEADHSRPRKIVANRGRLFFCSAVRGRSSSRVSEIVVQGCTPGTDPHFCPTWWVTIGAGSRW